MKKARILLYVICLGSLCGVAQTTNYDPSTIFLAQYQNLMRSERFEEARHLLESNKPLFDAEENGEQLYSVFIGTVAIGAYMKTRSIDSLMNDLPHINNYMSILLDSPSSLDPSSMWGNLSSFSLIYKDINDPRIETIYQFADEYYKTHPSEDYLIYRYILNNTLEYYITVGRFQEALEITEKIYDILIKNNDSSILVPNILYIAGRLYLHKFDNAKMAKHCLSQSYKLYQDFKNELHNNEDYYYLLSDLSTVYFNEVKLKESFEYAMQLLNILEEDGITQGEFYFVALLLLTNAADNYKDMVNYAELAYKASLYLPEDDENRRTAIQKLKWAYAVADIPSNQQIHLNKFNKIIDTGHKLLFMEAITDYESGDLESAKQKFLKVISYHETNGDVFDDYEYSRSIIMMIAICNTEGNVPLGDQIFWRASNYYETSGRKCKYTHHLYCAAGLLHYSIGDYQTARDYLEESLRLFNLIGDDESMDYALTLNNLALVYIELGEKLKAKICLEESKDLVDTFVKRNDKQSLPIQLLIMSNVGEMYFKIGYTSEAIRIHKEVLSYCESDEKYNDAKANTLYSLVSVLIAKEQYDEAKEYLLQLTELPLNIRMKMTALEARLCLKNYTNDETAIDDLLTFNSYIRDDISSVFGTFTEIERENYWDSMSNAMSVENNYLADKYPTSKAVTYAYDNALFCKGLLLRSTKLLDEIVRNESDETLQQMYQQMKLLEKKISSKSTPSDSIPSYYRDISQLKKQILLSIPNFNTRLQSSFVTVSDVQTMMDENDIAIEFIIIPRLIKYGQSEDFYGALILRKNDNMPRIVTLCLVDSLKGLMNAKNPNDDAFINGIYGLNDERLYHLIWEILEPELKENANVYYSPAGYINSINLGAIAHNGERMANRYNLYQVSSTAEIQNVKNTEDFPIDSAVIYGDIDYGATLSEMAYNARTYSSRGTSQTVHNRGDFATRAWGPLAYTREEAQTVNDMFLSHHKESKLLMGATANEESFKAMNGCAPNVIHIATHGFYFEDKKNTPTDFFKSLTTLTRKGSSMLYSGLLFAGANNAWINDSISPDVEDGILTAQEIGQMDLSNADIVVLSACQTALGDIDKLNGVFGLQRGLKQAGAKTLVMSLWEVPDAETCELMTEFYRILLSGVEKHEAFRQAQKKLQQHKPDPYYWAAFVLLD